MPLLLLVFLCRYGRSHDLYSCSSCLLQNSTDVTSSVFAVSLEAGDCTDKHQPNPKKTERNLDLLKESGSSEQSKKKYQLIYKKYKAKQKPCIVIPQVCSFACYCLSHCKVCWAGACTAPVYLCLYSACAMSTNFHWSFWVLIQTFISI